MYSNNSKSLNNLQDKTINNENETEKSLSSYIDKINKSFFYAEKVLTFSAIVMIIGFAFFILTHLHGIQLLSNIKMFETGVLTANLFFILFLTITLFAFAHKLLLDIILWKKHNIKLPLIISLFTLIVILASSFAPPLIAFLIILLCSLSVGMRIHSSRFLDTITEITEKESLIEPKV